jgi:hypothetical protein
MLAAGPAARGAVEEESAAGMHPAAVLLRVDKLSGMPTSRARGGALCRLKTSDRRSDLHVKKIREPGWLFVKACYEPYCTLGESPARNAKKQQNAWLDFVAVAQDR